MTLTLTRPQEAPPMPSSTPQRRRYTSRGRQDTAQLTAQRDTQQQARAYAEAWYQTLRRWEAVLPVARVPAVSYAGFADRWGYTDTLGEAGPPQATMLNTPAGQMLEGEVALEISRMAWASGSGSVTDLHVSGALLDRVRSGQGLSSLLREGGGWSAHRERAQRYALAVLTLAVRLRDPEAEAHLSTVTAEVAHLFRV